MYHVPCQFALYTALKLWENWRCMALCLALLHLSFLHRQDLYPKFSPKIPQNSKICTFCIQYWQYWIFCSSDRFVTWTFSVESATNMRYALALDRLAQEHLDVKRWCNIFVMSGAPWAPCHLLAKNDAPLNCDYDYRMGKAEWLSYNMHKLWHFKADHLCTQSMKTFLAGHKRYFLLLLVPARLWMESMHWHKFFWRYFGLIDFINQSKAKTKTK